MWLMQNAFAKPDNAGAGATDFMHLFGLVALGYMWARIAKAALAKQAEAPAPRWESKLASGRFFMERMLPETAPAPDADQGRRRRAPWRWRRTHSERLAGRTIP